MRDYGKIISKLSSTPWLMTEDGLDTLLAVVSARLNGGAVTEEMLAEVSNRRGEREYYSMGAQVVNGVGVLPMEGPVFGKANLMTSLSGATSLQMFRQDFRSMLQDDAIHSIVFEMDTPGGSSDFVQETAAEIFASREVKPTYAIANNQCGSAGLFLASQATKLYSTPSGEVGSLGVFRVHVDQSQKDQKDGYKFSYIKAGQYKTEGNPHEPLTLEAAQHHQAGVNELYDEFVATVAQGRGVSTEHVLQNFGQGRMLSAKDAKTVNMIDDVVEMDALVGQLQSRPVQVSVTLPDGSSSVGILSGGGSNLSFQLEHAAEEHAEPGSGTPPIPRTDEDDRSGDRNNSRSRRDTPPIANPNSGTVTDEGHQTSSQHGEEEQMNDAILSALGLSAGATDDMVLAAITTLNGQVSANQAAELQARTFAEQFPEQAAQLAAFSESQVTTAAQRFVQDNNWIMAGDSRTQFALSSLASDEIAKCHALIASGDDSALESFESVIALLNTTTARVRMGEEGSSLPVDPDTPNPDSEDDEDTEDVEENTSVNQAAKRLNKRALSLQVKAGGGSKMSFGDALSAAAKEMPIAARIYRGSLNDTTNRGQ